MLDATSAPFPLAAPMNVGLLTPHNPYDRRTFSGTPYFAAQALGRHPALRLRVLGTHKRPNLTDRLLRRSPPVLPADAEVDVTGLDAVVGLVASGHLAALSTRHPNTPFFHITDATPEFLREAYGWKLDPNVDRIEAQVAAHATSVVYSSAEMAARAATDLGLGTLQATHANFGINMEQLPSVCPEKRPMVPLNLLFVGLDWHRKGGDRAVAALDALRADGWDAHLTIVGRLPEAATNHPAITYAGFLNKNRPADAVQLTRLYEAAHFLILPTRGDCTPMVVGEAMAHGTPVIASDTGGMGSLLGQTGQLMPQTANARDWADAIAAMTGAVYASEVKASFHRAHHALNWERWADQIALLLLKSVGKMAEDARNVA